MLAAAYRLRRSNDFAAAVRGGRRAGRGAVVVHLSIPDENPSILDETGTDQLLTERPEPNPRSVAGNRYGKQYGEPARTARSCGIPVRAGFVVSKAIGGAVVRNKVRRRLRHLVGERLNQLPAGATLVVRALPGAAVASYHQLGADLDAAIESARAPRQRRGSRRRG